MSCAPLLKSIYEKNSFMFQKDNNGNDIPLCSSEINKEYEAVRNQIGISDLSSVELYKISGEDTIDYLDYIVCGDVAGLREEEALHSCVVDNQGKLVADVYVANNDEYCILMADGGDYQTLGAILEKHRESFDIDITAMNDEYSMFSVDGPYAWKPMKDVFSSEILGIGYLDFMVMEDEGDTHIARLGKTGEIGYWVLSKKDMISDILQRILESANGNMILPYGAKVLEICKMENNYLNYSEAICAKNPYELGLFWQIFIDKEIHAGTVLREILEDGIKRWTVGFTSEVENKNIQIGENISHNGDKIGEVINVGHSPQLKKTIGVAIMDRDYAYSNLNFMAGTAHINTITRPCILNKSLSVRPE